MNFVKRVYIGHSFPQETVHFSAQKMNSDVNNVLKINDVNV